MDMTRMPDDASNDSQHLEKQLHLLNSLTRDEFDIAEKMIDSKLQCALDSLDNSARSIRMLLEAQSPAELASPAGLSLRGDLEGLLASSTHLARLAAMMQQGFTSSRDACERRTEQQIASVVDAVDKHRAAVQDNAIALTEAALDRARAPSPLSHASRAAERRPR
jgi:hypothetical protein